MLVDFDADLEADGSLQAKRVKVQDSDAVNLSFANGPITSVDSNSTWGQAPILLAADAERQGTLQGWMGAAGLSYDNTVFQVSTQLSNLRQLPFEARLTESNMVAGQKISFTSQAATVSNAIPLSTITLMPQTINGTVVGISREGGFDTYTVRLADYDLFPQLAVQKYQTTLLTDPGTLIVYADSHTKQLNTQPIAVGSAVRFNGAVFNDNGTLRMDCLQINDGVPE
jgi:hypothetical protein